MPIPTLPVEQYSPEGEGLLATLMKYLGGNKGYAKPAIWKPGWQKAHTQGNKFAGGDIASVDVEPTE